MKKQQPEQLGLWLKIFILISGAFGGFIAMLGIGLFVLPAGILALGFSKEIQRKKVKGKSKK